MRLVFGSWRELRPDQVVWVRWWLSHLRLQIRPVSVSVLDMRFLQRIWITCFLSVYLQRECKTVLIVKRQLQLKFIKSLGKASLGSVMFIYIWTIRTKLCSIFNDLWRSGVHPELLLRTPEVICGVPEVENSYSRLKVLEETREWTLFFCQFILTRKLRYTLSCSCISLGVICGVPKVENR